MIDEGVTAVLAARATTRNGDDSHTSGTDLVAAKVLPTGAGTARAPLISYWCISGVPDARKLTTLGPGNPGHVSQALHRSTASPT
ncbi:hypothetical protein Tco_0553765 [Tanacetum coccineum]